jgi:transcriptional regulator with XRE-family HTH domain
MPKHGGWDATGFGRRLKAQREAAGISQEQLAQRAGCTVATVSRLERELVEPAWPLVLAFCRALGVRTAAFEPAADETASVSSPAPRGRPSKSPAATDQGAAQQGKPARGKRKGK